MTPETGSEKSPIHVTATAESAIAYSLDVEVDAKRVGKAFERAYRDLGKKVHVKGFRPGKAPRSVLEKLYAPSVAEPDLETPRRQAERVRDRLVDPDDLEGARGLTRGVRAEERCHDGSCGRGMGRLPRTRTERRR